MTGGLLQVRQCYPVPRSSSDACGMQQLLLIAVGLVVIPTLLFVKHDSIFSGVQEVASLPPSSLSGRSAEGTGSWQLLPTLEYVNETNTEFVWQLPKNGKPKGVLFIAHGCRCRSTFFWDKHPNCRACIGLPEERTLVLNALARGYAVIAISSTYECWEISVDKAKVKSTLNRWIQRHNLGSLPVSGLGASSGGYFLSLLAQEFKFQSLVIMIAEGRFEVMDFDSDYPPTLFVHMPKDQRRARGVKQAMKMLRSKGVETQEVECFEVPVTPYFFSERIPALDHKASQKIVALLHDFHIVNESGYMMVDGRQRKWSLPLRKRHILPWNARISWEHHLEEEMNVAYAWHEMTSLPSESIFYWFDKHNVAQAVRRAY